MELSQILGLHFFIVVLAFSSATLPINQPQTNIWVTLANASGSDTMCLATTTPENSFSTCLVGLPADAWSKKEKIIHALGSKSASHV